MATSRPRRKRTKIPRAPRRPRPLSPGETRVKAWLDENYGVLSEIAREVNLSPTFVQRIAYNREARSQGWRVERLLKERGCPLMQTIPEAA